MNVTGISHIVFSILGNCAKLKEADTISDLTCRQFICFVLESLYILRIQKNATMWV